MPTVSIPLFSKKRFEQQRPRMLVVTPSYQNPTGATLSLDRRKRIVELAQRYSVVLVENDIYSELRYQGPALPTLKQLDDSGNTILLRSYSKVSFPGLRVGWVDCSASCHRAPGRSQATQRSSFRSTLASCAPPLCRVRRTQSPSRTHPHCWRRTPQLCPRCLRPFSPARVALHSPGRRHESLG